MTFPHASRATSIEPLESRIAPALLVNGANLLGGAGNPTSGETSVGGDSVTLVKVLSGQAIVWFEDGFVNAISFGPNANLEIHGDVGDLIGNLGPNGRLSDSDNDPTNGDDGNLLLPNTLVGLKTLPLSGQKGDVQNIVTGGSVLSGSISGKLSGIYAGDGVFRVESTLNSGGSVEVSVGVTVNPVTPPADPQLAESFVFNSGTSKFQPGASIKNVTIETAQEAQIFAGNGDVDGNASALAGAAGGSIENLTINSAFVSANAVGNPPSYFLHAGDGENGKTGGAGGSIVGVLEKTSSGTIRMVAGNGGIGGAGPGGAGGSVRMLEMLSDSSVYDITAGNGGNGIGGGAGGSAVSNNFANRTPTNSILLAEDFTGDGLDDVLVVDTSSGQMVLSENQGGSSFTKVVQHTPPGGDPVVTIDTLGTTPIDAVATDWDSDGDLDVVVAYKNSTSLGVYINDGTGVFWDSINDTVNGKTASLGAAPSLMSLDRVGGNGLIIVSGDGQKSTIQHFIADTDKVYVGTEKTTKVAGVISDVIPALSSDNGNYAYIALASGSIQKLTPVFDPELEPYTVTAAGFTVTGGVSNLDVDSTGHQILALHSTTRGVDVFDVGTGGALTSKTGPDISTRGGRAVVARFVEDTSGNSDAIGVLWVLSNGSRFDYFTAPIPDDDPATQDPAYILNKSLTTTPTLKNFAFVEGSGEPSIAAVGGSLSQFFYSRTLVDLTEFALPFVGKKVSITAGNGGDAADLGTVVGKAGAGGSIVGVNIDAIDIKLTAGFGGDSFNGAGGAGGSVMNPLNFVSKSGGIVAPRLLAEETLEITVGSGGGPLGPGGKTASGGDAGSISGLSISIASTDINSGAVKLTTKDGGTGKGGNGGRGGDISGVNVLSLGGSLTIELGDGGDALLGNVKGGNGGSLVNFKYELQLDSQAESIEKAYFITVNTGEGGAAPQGTGGNGGGVSNTTLKLDGADSTIDGPFRVPAVADDHKDSTVSVSIHTGNGGGGLVGGAGGSILGIGSTSVFDQKSPGGFIVLNYVVMDLVAGNGGDATGGNGGAGGSITVASTGLAGITTFDPDAVLPIGNPSGIPLIVSAGNGGGGSVKGGAGGGIAGLLAKNSPFTDGSPITRTHLGAAILIAGNGGSGGSSDGGRGGDITRANLAVQDGPLIVFSGTGGNGGAAALGGSGGKIADSYFGTVNSDLFVQSGGGGGAGKLAGAGGLISNIQVNTPEIGSGASASIVAGNGGAASAVGGIGGAGGDIVKISQGKDINSAIKIIQAGNGGASAAGPGGRGGNVGTVKTVGFIGAPSDGSSRLGVFDGTGAAQGIFVGRGGAGSVAGLAGSVTGVTARQIAAIAAAVAPDGTFGVATKVSQVKADLIGYDKDADGVFDDSVGGSATPSGTKPIDGFILAKSLLAVSGAKPAFIFTA